ncbi:MAG TPA: carboxypeptidase regulatory-like domain-containing protein [Acidobacteriaceae bacterium]|nr:carboxypeptidase regulatory-like domain-containing protein [Acidobacteriaceae bacterium]
MRIVPSIRPRLFRLRHRLVILLLLSFLPASLVRAQNLNGALRGVVQDSTGARVAGARVAAQTIGTSISRVATTDEQGKFLLDGLLPGSYRVIVTAAGFAQATANVDVAVSLMRDLRVTLKPAGASETVSVQGNPSSITAATLDTSSAVRGGVVSTQDLAAFPLPDRSFANIAYLVPGTEPVEPSDPTKARITAVSTGGSSGLNNELSVDGADDSDDWIGGFLQNFSPDGIQEFAVRTSNENADTGWTTGGSVVITTKHGTNQLHGDAAFYERAAALNARFPIENPAETCTSGVCVHNPKQPFSRQNYVGTLGGPIAKDKVWFFTSFENVHENASIAYSPASTRQFQALSQIASEGLIAGVPSIAAPASVPVPFRDYLGSARFDWAQSPRSRWFLRASQDSYTTHNALVEQGTLPSTGLLTHNNYWNAVVGNSTIFSPTWLGNLVLAASLLHLTQTRNSNLGFALAFPFSSTALTISGFETFGDNQFATPITLFPDLRNQDKYQARYDLTHVAGNHDLQFGVDFIHEPVLSGAFASTAEEIIQYPSNPDCYVNPTGADCGGISSALPFYFVPPSSQCNPGPSAASGINCTYTPAGDGSFSQNVQRLALYAEDSWRVSRRLTASYGLRYQTTFGLFEASGRSQTENPAYITLQALQIPIVPGVPHDDRGQVAPRLGFVYGLGSRQKTVVRGGFGLFFEDLAQNGWATAFQGINDTNATTGTCALTGSPGSYALTGSGCLQGGAGTTGNLIGSDYKTPYAIQVTGGAEHAFNERWLASADYVHVQGNHGYRAFPYSSGANLFTPAIAASDPNYAADQTSVVPNVNVFQSDNRSSYNALMLHAQGNMRRFSLVANYQFSKAQTWGCLLGELFDYVDGVCTLQSGPNAGQLDAFGPGDYGPSGEDVRHRFVFAGTLRAPAGFELSGLAQLESARPITITNADNTGRIWVNGVYTSLDEFRGTPYMQTDLRVARPFRAGERWQINPFVEFFNLFNRNNPGANYAVNVTQLPVPAAQMQPNAAGITNVTDICTNSGCSRTAPITSLKQLEIPEGALGDFFGPGTTVGIPFAAQLGIRATF